MHRLVSMYTLGGACVLTMLPPRLPRLLVEHARVLVQLRRSLCNHKQCLRHIPGNRGVAGGACGLAVEVIARRDVLDRLVDILLAREPAGRTASKSRRTVRVSGAASCVVADGVTCWTWPRTASVCCCTSVSFDVSGVLYAQKRDGE